MLTKLSCPVKSAGRTSGRVWVFYAAAANGQPVRTTKHNASHAFIVHPPS